jgi:hypothetical protein
MAHLMGSNFLCKIMLFQIVAIPSMSVMNKFKQVGEVTFRKDSMASSSFKINTLVSGQDYCLSESTFRVLHENDHFEPGTLIASQILNPIEQKCVNNWFVNQ